ncbi:MAG: hypothetical protein ACYC6Y_31940, partial [Thermoguttaceae bacterium]
MFPLHRGLHHGGAGRIATVALLAAWLSIPAVGCAPANMAQLNGAPRHSLLARLKLVPASRPRASARTEQFVRVNDLADEGKTPD